MSKACYVRVRPETHEQIKRLAQAEGRLMCAIVERAIRLYERFSRDDSVPGTDARQTRRGAAND